MELVLPMTSCRLVVTPGQLCSLLLGWLLLWWWWRRSPGGEVMEWGMGAVKGDLGEWILRNGFWGMNVGAEY